MPLQDLQQVVTSMTEHLSLWFTTAVVDAASQVSIDARHVAAEAATAAVEEGTAVGTASQAPVTAADTPALLYAQPDEAVGRNQSKSGTTS